MEIKAVGAGLRQVAIALIAKAATGDVPAIREIADRIDGKVPKAADVAATMTVIVRDLSDTADEGDRARAAALMARQMVTASVDMGIEADQENAPSLAPRSGKG